MRGRSHWYDKINNLMKRFIFSVLTLSSLAIAPNNAIAQETPGQAFERWASLCQELDGREGLDACDRALEIAPDNATLWTNRGVILYNLPDRNQDALEALNRALEIAPDYSLALYNRCVTLAQIGRYTEAVESCDRALEGNGVWGAANPSAAWINRGVALRRLGRYQEALESYDSAIELNANNPLIWNNKGTILFELQRYEEALAAFEQALTIDEDFDLAQRNRDILLERLQQ
jgi:tetratricopeptide (TPR) repeat protein